jgi:flagellar FliL protein
MPKTRKTELDIDLVPEAEKKDAEKKDDIEREEKSVEKIKSKGFFSKKKILIFSALAIILVLAITISIFLIYKKSPPIKVEPVKKTKSEEGETVPIYSFEPFFIPVKHGDSEERFLKISLSIELSDKDVTREVEKNITFLRENILFILKAKGLKNFQEKDERERLTKDIVSAINLILQTGTVVRLYFTEFLIL